jgi:radical SAM protein with 4Fe4S-binding SPASM domain
MIERIKCADKFAMIGATQKLNDKDAMLKISNYTVPFEYRGKFLFNELTREFLELTDDEWEQIPFGKKFAYDDSNELLKKLFEKYYIIPEDTDETEQYLSLNVLMKALRKKTNGIVQYTIFPTSTCNARCVYCFEENFVGYTMTKEIQDQVVKYILETRDPDRTISLLWFGGEPLVGSKIIDYICGELKKNNVKYQSMIVTNASLLTEEIADKMKNEWNIKQVQITLDGTQEEYDARKCYIDDSHSWFPQAILAIHRVSERGIPVMIRLNMDRNNVKNLRELIDYLEVEFPEKENLYIYPGMLQQLMRDHNAMNMWGEFASLMDYARDKGFASGGLRKSTLDTMACVYEDYEHSAVIDPRGKLTKCQHIVDDTVFYSDVFNYNEVLNRDAWEEITRPNRLREKCRGCSYLPACTDFDKCPNEKVSCKVMKNAIEMCWLRYEVDRIRSNDTKKRSVVVF